MFRDRRRRTLAVGFFGAIVLGMGAFAIANSNSPPPAVPPLPPTPVPAPPAATPAPTPPPIAPVVPVPPVESPAARLQNPIPPVSVPQSLPSPLPVVPQATPELKSPTLPAAKARDTEILEPVVSTHRFEGRFLGSWGDDVIRYVPLADDRAGIVCGPAEPAIPPADGERVAADRYRVPVPAGTAVRHGSMVYVVAARAVVAVGEQGGIEWEFRLPGKPDAGDRLLGISDFDGLNVLVAAEYDPGTRQEEPTGRIFTLEAKSGRLVDCVKFPSGFGGTSPSIYVSEKTVYAMRNMKLFSWNLATGQLLWSRAHGPSRWLAAARNGVLVTSPNSGTAHLLRSGQPWFSSGVATARPVVCGRVAYIPIVNGSYFVQRIDPGDMREDWSIPLPHEITVQPLLTNESLYVVSGRALYRLDRSSGAICWRLTLPLRDGESIIELLRDGDAICAAGRGMVVRVTNSTGIEAMPKVAPEPQASPTARLPALP